MEIAVIFWLGLSVLAAVVAGNKGRSAVGFFLLAALVSPLIGLLAAFVVGRGDSYACPFCKELVKYGATVCPHCRKDVPLYEKPGENISSGSDDLTYG